MLHQSDITCFRDRGLISLPGFFAPEVIAPLRATVWDFLNKRDGIQANAPATWPQKPVTKLNKLSQNPVFDALHPPRLDEVLSALTPGQSVQPFASAGNRQVLVTFPNATSWQLPHSVWHTDLPHEVARRPPPGLQSFICLDEVAPQGGGTLVLAGSHRVEVGGAGTIASGKFKKLFEKQSTYASALFDETTPNRNALLQTAGSYEGIALQPVELTGQAGDVYIMDMRLLHTLSPNVLDRPRLVVTQRFAVAA